MAGGFGLLSLSLNHPYLPLIRLFGTLTSYRCPFFRRVRDQSLQALEYPLPLSLQAGIDRTRELCLGLRLLKDTGDRTLATCHSSHSSFPTLHLYSPTPHV